MKVARKVKIHVNPSEVVMGDVMTIKLKNGRKFTATAIDNKNGEILFVFDDCVCERPMNEKGGTEGGYEKSDMRKYLTEEFYELLPDKLKNKLLADSNGDKVFLLSLEEVTGCDSDFNDCPGQLEYFKARKNRVADYEGNYAAWWLRSVVSSANFAVVRYAGHADSDGASGAIGVRPAFAISA
jgi:hypothetical protein